jgi:hypothetical protein
MNSDYFITVGGELEWPVYGKRHIQSAALTEPHRGTKIGSLKTNRQEVKSALRIEDVF